MKVVNNKIYIFKGETPTFNACFITKENGAPYILLDDYNNPTLDFIVRKGLYAEDNCYAMRYFLSLADIHKFPTVDIATYSNADWDNSIKPTAGNELKLHRRNNAVSDVYRYFEYSDPEDFESSGEWVAYSFNISVPFLRIYTEKLEPKTYQYEIALIAGNNPEEGLIDFKEVLLPPTDFIVEGSVSE